MKTERNSKKNDDSPKTNGNAQKHKARFIICDRGCPQQAIGGSGSHRVSGYELQGWSNPSKTEQYNAQLREIPTEALRTATWAHGPFCGLSAGSAEPLQRAITAQRYSDFQRATEVCGIKKYVLHFNHSDEIDRKDKWHARFVTFWRNYLLDQDSEVLFLHENTLEHSPEYIASVMCDIDDPRMGVCLDLGHLNCTGGDIEKWLCILQPWIRYFHLHDNHGPSVGHFYDRDEHLPPGAGTIPWNCFSKYWTERYAHVPLGIECSATGIEKAVLFLETLLGEGGGA